MDSNSIQQQQQVPYRPFYPATGLEQLTPKMQMILVQLRCEIPPGLPPTAIRWVRQGSSAITSAAVIIADGQNSVDPFNYAVKIEPLPNGAVRSVLTVLSPNPTANQVNQIFPIEQ